jgi:hypothetical protein
VAAAKPSNQPAPRVPLAELVKEVKASSATTSAQAMEVEEPEAGPSTSPDHLPARPIDHPPAGNDEGPSELPEFPVVSDEEEDRLGLPALPEDSDIEE